VTFVRPPDFVETVNELNNMMLVSILKFTARSASLPVSRHFYVIYLDLNRVS